MRQVMSISLPEKEVKRIRVQAKQRGFKNFSAYISHLISEDTYVITEKELLKMVKQADKDYAAGKTKELKSLKDLLWSLNTSFTMMGLKNNLKNCHNKSR